MTQIWESRSVMLATGETLPEHLRGTTPPRGSFSQTAISGPWAGWCIVAARLSAPGYQ